MFARHHSDSDEQWAPVSDLMAVTMLMFMLIAMILFVNFTRDYYSNKQRCEQTHEMLDEEFNADFARWGAVLEDDLTIRFTDERVLFPSGEAIISEVFANRLGDFFPRYVDVIKKIRGQFGATEILAARIEGHTSSVYENPGRKSAFIRNMELSQDRAREILDFVTNPARVPEARNYGIEVRRLFTANGLSSSRLICHASGRENKRASRRVEFKLLTKSCQRAGEPDKQRLRTPACNPEAFK